MLEIDIPLDSLFAAKLDVAILEGVLVDVDPAVEDVKAAPEM
jgi:hypothetical protein